jgi:hypothetical protein
MHMHLGVDPGPGPQPWASAQSGEEIQFIIVAAVYCHGHDSFWFQSYLIPGSATVCIDCENNSKRLVTKKYCSVLH